jgi:hypothetical protein
VQVFFDLNGEYWGRNFYPTCALSQYEEHIQECRDLGAVWVNGRISTGHDRRSPHFNVLPSRRRFYSVAEGADPKGPIPDGLEVCCFDTLGGFNAEYFCACIRNGAADRRAAVQMFLRSEFGPAIDELAAVLMDVESVAARVFFAGQNYFSAQSLLPTPALGRFWALDLQMTAPGGEPFAPRGDQSTGRAAFSGWPIPRGLRAQGVRGLIAEKREALADAERLLARAEKAVARLTPEDRSFILRQFADLAMYARAASALLEAMVHYYHVQAGKRDGEIPNMARLGQLVEEMKRIADEWRQRQPHDEWRIATILSEWTMEIPRAGVGG